MLSVTTRIQQDVGLPRRPARSRVCPVGGQVRANIVEPALRRARGSSTTCSSIDRPPLIGWISRRRGNEADAARDRRFDGHEEITVDAAPPSTGVAEARRQLGVPR